MHGALSDDRSPTPAAQGASRATVFHYLLAASGAFLVGAIAWAAWRGGSPAIDASDAQLVAAGRQVYGQYCASCHGEHLEGQPAWRERGANGRLPAPPHDASGHTWHHPDAVLIEIVSAGLETGRYAQPGYRSDMPGFATMLSEQQIRASLAYIKSRWPEGLRQHQAQLTREAAAR